MRLRRWVVGPIALLGLALAPGASRATVIISAGNNPQPNEANILLNGAGTGMTITGQTNTSPPVDVTFASTQILTAPAQGQARIEAQDSGGTQVSLTNLSITPAANFQDLIFNAFQGGRLGTATAINFTVNSSLNGVSEPATTGTFSLNGNGSNFFTIVASGGEVLNSVSFTTTGGGLTDVRQVRISGIEGVRVVPEPSSLLMTGAAGLSLVGYAWRRRKRAA